VSYSRIQGILAPLLTLVVLIGLLVCDPCRYLRDLFAKAGQVSEDTRIAYFTDPNTQEVSNGENPLASLRQLESYWCAFGKDARYIIAGNSQTLTVLLAPSEPQIADADRTYPDLLLDRLNSANAHMHGYRLSAPNISYMEVLWYLNYLILHPCLVPSELVVQLNFDTFRKTGVREGMLELLEDPQFASSIEQEARSPAAYSGMFQQAINKYRTRLASQKGGETGAAFASNTGLAEARGTGGVIETAVRTTLDKSALFKERRELKSELLDFLYLARVRLLGITPTTKRSIGGGSLTANVSSLERIGELCRTNDIRLVFFNAPQNPNAPLYRSPSDAEDYRRLVSRLAYDHAAMYYDFENSIPGQMWGVWVDGPDPVHFGRAAHHRLAELMFERNVIEIEH
jgi:hypothetical protein